MTAPVFVTGLSVAGSGDQTQFATGPLNKLYKDKFKNNIYQFPADLGQDNRGHVIMFTVQKALPASQQGLTNSEVTQVITSAREVTSGTVEATVQLVQGNVAGAVEAVTTPTGKATEPIRNFLSALTSGLRREDGDSIALYVPDTVNVQYAAQYSDVSLTGALGKPLFLAQGAASVFDKLKTDQSTSQKISSLSNDPFVRATVTGIVQNAIGTSGLQELAVGAVGYAFNPQLQVLFTNVGFRTFQFDFILTPKNDKEAAEIQNIIRTFKKAAAPEFEQGFITNQSLFMKVPDAFKIKFLYNGQENLNVNRIGDCVLESIDIDYSPNGWSTFKDGSAVQTRLTMQFKEIFIIDKNRINEGY